MSILSLAVLGTPIPELGLERGFICRQWLKGRWCQGKGRLRLNREYILYVCAKWQYQSLVDCEEGLVQLNGLILVLL